jgi:cytoskeletal protein CcmA (bactofilin family)
MKKVKFNTDAINTFIGEETEFKGVLNSQGSIHIEGTVEGEINSQGEVYLGLKCKAKANITAQKVIIAGELLGNVEAIKGLKICSQGKVYGDLTGDRLIIEEGAIYKGKVNMDIISSQNIYEGKFEIVK